MIIDGVVLLGFLAAVFATATTGSLFRPDDWYRQLNKPKWTPRDWVFPVAWSILYVLIAVSGFWIYLKVGFAAAAFAFGLFALQLFLNAAWSVIFFGMKRIGWALVDVMLLWVCIFALIVSFSRHDVGAALLLVPYLIWVSLAGALNMEIYRRNPSASAKAPVT